MPRRRPKIDHHPPVSFNSPDSLRAMQMAMVQFMVRKGKPMTKAFAQSLANLPKADAADLARRLSNWLGRPHICHSRVCRRARTCQGEPPDCWRSEPPPLPVEAELAAISLERQISEMVENVADKSAPSEPRRSR